MSLIEKISERELKMFDRYRRNYVENCVGNPAPVETILSYWDFAKRGLYNLLGENLMIDKEIVSEKTEYEMEQRINDLLIYKKGEFVKAWQDFIYESFIRLSLDKENPEFVMYYNMDRLMLPESLIYNTYNGETFFVNFPNGDKYKVQKGCKVSKALGKIADAFDIPGYEEFRIAHSQILNERKLKGTMTLSIHPLDYATMSDNNCDWSSCMSWEEGGEYRRGTVEMMNSTCVIIAYLNASEPMMLPGGESWSNKKWRELFIVNEDFICGIKGYPYWNRDLEKTALDWIKELAEKNWGVKYTDNLYKLDAPNDKCSVDIEELDRKVSFHLWTEAMYNDCYDIHYTYINKELAEDFIDICYSGYSECMWCGSVDNCFNYESNLVCTSCDNEMYCAHCGERIYPDDAYCINGEYYCEYCYNDFPRCDGCDEIIPDGYTTRVYLAQGGKIYQWYYVDLCYDCVNYNEHIDNKLFKEHEIDRWRVHTYINLDDIDPANEDAIEYLEKAFRQNNIKLFFERSKDLGPYWEIKKEEK